MILTHEIINDINEILIYIIVIHVILMHDINA